MTSLKPALQYSEGRSRNWSGAALTNCFSERADGDKRKDFAVMASPGLTLWATVGVGPFRGAIMCDGLLYVVSGELLYSVNAAGAATMIGSIGGTGPVRMAANYTQVCIVAGEVGYCWDGTTLAQPVPFAVSDVAYFDGYMIWSVLGQELFIISALDDALVYDTIDVASAEGSPDNILGILNCHRELHLYGPGTTEIFYNSGNFDFPFERQGNSFIERGTFDRDSLVKIDNAAMFVGDDRIVYTMAGYTPQRVSTHAIEYALRDATYARAWEYAQEGHLFYVLECDRGTFAFDRTTGAWHRRQSYLVDHWRCNGSVTAYGRVLFGDRENGNLYIPSLDVHSENGAPLRAQIDLPTIEGDRERHVMHSFETVCEMGVGNADAPDPQIMLQYSDDGGHTWSNEMWRPLGAVGATKTRAMWRRLGQFRQRSMRLAISDPTRKFVISYHADMS